MDTPDDNFFNERCEFKKFNFFLRTCKTIEWNTLAPFDD